ncbi:MAG: 5-formyltetrahydrofolate cyclo-ligase [Ruminococcus sp.]|nr:5-formyltetrahydrofolate cyclo-ligase [Ruminococcus sp.]
MHKVMDKSALRKRFKSVRLSMSDDEKNACDKKIWNNVVGLPEYRACSDLLIYVSSNIEVSTREIMTSAFGEKNVLCPKCVSGTNKMYFYDISDFSRLERGAYGILEPDDSCEMRKVFENAVCIVPGLSYDGRGYRLGFGKGYYDRFLSDFDGIKIGLCYECCISEILPNDKYDIKADILVTEKQIIRFEL